MNRAEGNKIRVNGNKKNMKNEEDEEEETCTLSQTNNKVQQVCN